MPKEKHIGVDPEVLSTYRKMIAAVDGVELKGDTCPFTSINGHMNSAISRGNRIGLRLAKKDLQEFLDKHDTTLFEPFQGFIQKTYVSVPESMMSNMRTLRKYFRMSHEYASSMEPKATKKK